MEATSAAEQLAKIDRYEVQRLKKQGNGKVQVAFAHDVKDSLLFRFDWGGVLSAAPLALSLMGSCHVAATSTLAHDISLATPKDGFKYIKYSRLTACLVQVSDAGRLAFIRAETYMDRINNTSVFLGNYMSSISQYLPHLPDSGAQYVLFNKLQLLQDASNDCFDHAKRIEEVFENWLLLVCELHQVTLETQGNTAGAQNEHKIDIARVKLEADLTKDTLGSTVEMAKTLKKVLDSSRKSFEKGENAPGPWESIRLCLANNNITQATIAFSQTMSKMVGFGKTLRDPGAVPGTHVPNTLPDDGSDPAYPASINVSTLITIFVTLLNDVDWDGLKAKIDAERWLTFLMARLQHHLDTVEWTDKAPSCELKQAINLCMGVIGNIESMISKDEQLTSHRPTPEVIGEWQGIVKDAKALVTKLSAAAQILPGGAPGTAPPLNAPANSARSEDRIDKLSALSVAVEKLKITQAAYTAAQENYTKASNKAAIVGEKHVRMKADLKSLMENEITIDDIMKILIQCIETLIQMKSQITNLVRFFGAFSAMVEHVVKKNVENFVQQAKSTPNLLFGNLTVLDIFRQELYVTSLTCQAWFSLFSTVAKMYTKISIDHIMPGVTLCDKLSMPDGGDRNAIGSRVQALNKFTDDAQKMVRDLISKTQAEIAATLEDRVQLVAKDVEVLPKPPPEVANAITNGKKSITKAISWGPVNFQALDYSMDTNEI